LKIIAKTISIILNPLVVAPCTFGILIYTGEENSRNHIIFIISIFVTNIIPFLTILYFRKLNKITALEVPIREQRVQILAIAAIYNSLGFVLLNFLGATPIVKGLMFCYALNTFIVWAITIYWKISIHMFGLGGPIIALWLSGFQSPLLMAFVLILVSIARLILKIHTPTQVLIGAILAMGLAYIELKFLFL